MVSVWWNPLFCCVGWACRTMAKQAKQPEDRWKRVESRDWTQELAVTLLPSYGNRSLGALVPSQGTCLLTNKHLK